MNRFIDIQADLKFYRKNDKGIFGNKYAVQKSITFPSAQTIFDNYPDPHGDYCWATNECAIRMSIAFHNCAIDISGSSKYRKTHKKHKNKEKGSSVIHQPSAAAMADWLSKELKVPQKLKKNNGQYQLSDFSEKDGILYFAHSHRGGDGPGHIDILHNGNVGSGFYPNRTIWFWEYNGGW